MSEYTQPILSIAIPTWNRANILNQSLSYLLPQIEKYGNQIELIISDNASSDDTQHIINKKIERYNHINFVTYVQNENKGFYGNFKKCKQLANGTFFWLLSDNEFVNVGLLDLIIKSILENKDIFAIHLNMWDSLKKMPKTAIYTTEKVDKNDFFKKGGHKLTLISAVIFNNNKSNDTRIFKEFEGNSFLGFILFLQSFTYGEKAIIVTGLSLLSHKAKISFDVFNAFTIDLVKCVNFAINQKLISKQQEICFMNRIITNVSLNHYVEYKVKGNVYGKKLDSIKTVEMMYYNAYSTYPKFHEIVLPCFRKPKLMLAFDYYAKKVKKKLIDYN